MLACRGNAISNPPLAAANYDWYVDAVFSHTFELIPHLSFKTLAMTTILGRKMDGASSIMTAGPFFLSLALANSIFLSYNFNSVK